uniref:Ig-like domain-containing protein n=1 Tax=Chelonoidis abingdonii TaxID=106734 RepID=A0A8C0FZP5_CHEAB
MGRALPPQQDAREWELWAQGPPWRTEGPAPHAATLRVLILALLWRGSLAQQPRFTLTVPQSVSVQEGLCVLVPCTFMYPTWYNTNNPWSQLYRYWYKDQANVGSDLLVASTDPSQEVSQETQGRFQLAENPAQGDCSLQISDARRTDAGKYFFRFEKGTLKYSYRSNSYPTHPTLDISVPGKSSCMTMTCTAPGRCSGPPPRVTWTGPFSNTARDISVQLANGTWTHSSALSFTPGPGDHGKELVCTVTYRPPQGPSTRRTVQLHVSCDPNALAFWQRGHTLTHIQLLTHSEDDVVSLETWEGDSLSLGCEAGSRPEATLSWAKGNESLSPSQGRAGHLELPNLSRGDCVTHPIPHLLLVNARCRKCICRERGGNESGTAHAISSAGWMQVSAWCLCLASHSGSQDSRQRHPGRGCSSPGPARPRRTR